MKFIAFVIVFWGALNSWSKEFVLASLDWPPYTCPKCPGEGSAVIALRKLLKSEGHSLKIHFYSWPRCVLQAKKGQVDGIWPAWEADLAGTGLIPSSVIFSSELGVAERTEHPLKFSNFLDLSKYRIGAVEEYGYHSDFLELRKKGVLKPEIVHTDLQNLRKLEAKRIDAALVDIKNFQFLISHRLPNLKATLRVNNKILSKNALMVGMNPSISEELGQVIKKSLLKNKSIGKEIEDNSNNIILGSEEK